MLLALLVMWVGLIGTQVLTLVLVFRLNAISQRLSVLECANVNGPALEGGA